MTEDALDSAPCYRLRYNCCMSAVIRWSMSRGCLQDPRTSPVSVHQDAGCRYILSKPKNATITFHAAKGNEHASNPGDEKASYPGANSEIVAIILLWRPQEILRYVDVVTSRVKVSRWQPADEADCLIAPCRLVMFFQSRDFCRSLILPHPHKNSIIHNRYWGM